LWFKALYTLGWNLLQEGGVSRFLILKEMIMDAGSFEAVAYAFFSWLMRSAMR